jgi:hypothetical protein
LVPKVAFHHMIEGCRQRDADEEERFHDVTVLERRGRAS